MALEQAELAEVMTAWPLLSPDLRVAILAIVRSVAEAEAEEVVAKPPLEDSRRLGRSLALPTP